MDISNRNWIIGCREAARLQVVPLLIHNRELGCAGDGFELGLGEDDDLQQLVFVRFVVQELPQELQAEHRDLLALVDDQDGGLFLVDPLAEEAVLDELLGLPVGGASPGASRPQPGHREEIGAVLEEGVQDQWVSTLALNGG
jgi:hypothetical protein